MDDLLRKKLREHQRVDAEKQQRIGQRPEIAEDRAAIARLQVARGKRGDELPVAVQRAKLVHRTGVYPEHSDGSPGSLLESQLGRFAPDCAPGKYDKARPKARPAHVVS